MTRENAERLPEPNTDPEVEQVETLVEELSRDARNRAGHYLEDTVVPEGGE